MLSSKTKEKGDEDVMRLPLDAPIDFSVKSHLTDATFVFEGRTIRAVKGFLSLRSFTDATVVVESQKIHAGKDFLSLHSPFFRMLFFSGFAESTQEEIVLKEVTDEEFRELVRILYYMDCDIKDECIQSLLELGNRYDIKMIVDRVEDRLISSDFYTLAEKFLLADHYRLVKLQMKCFDDLNTSHPRLSIKKVKKHLLKNTVEYVKESREFQELSPGAQVAFTEFCDASRSSERVIARYSMMIPRESLMDEAALKNDSIASGEFRASLRINFVCPSIECDIGGLVWRLIAKLEVDNQLSFRLIVNNDRPLGFDWSAEGIIEIEIGNLVGQTVKKQARYTFNFNNSIRNGWTGLEQWNVSSFSLVISRVYVRRLRGLRDIIQFDFTKPSELSDATLIVGDKRIHVNKQYLSVVSNVFRAIFDGDLDGEKNEYELEGVEFPGEFIELLNVIYPCCKKITDASVDCLLKLGHHFQIACVIERVENFLLSAAKATMLPMKLQLADKYDLFRLQASFFKHCLSSLTTTEEVEQFENLPIYDDFSSTTKAALSERMRVLNKKKKAGMSPEKKKARLNESDNSTEPSDSDFTNGPPSGVIRFEVDKISTLGNGKSSPSIEVEGVQWRAKVSKTLLKSSDYLTTFLTTPPNYSTQWSIDFKAVYRLINLQGDEDVVKGQEKWSFDHKRNYCGRYMIPWEELIDVEKGFIKDGKIVIEIRFWILKMRGIRAAPRFDFTNPDDPRYDVTFVIGEKKIYASKQILAVHSPVFNVMFYGSFAEKDAKEIVLKDLDYEEFLEMLRFVYPSNQKMTDDSVQFLLKLGDRFQIKLILDLAEDHLISSNIPELAGKLLLSDQYILIKLQNDCLSKLTTLKEVKELEDAPEFKDLSDAMKAMLLERMFRLVPE